ASALPQRAPVSLHDALPISRSGLAGPLDLVQRVMSLEVECMQDTLANLSEPALRHLVTALAGAPSVLLIGTGTAAPLCQMFAYRDRKSTRLNSSHVKISYAV